MTNLLKSLFILFALGFLTTNISHARKPAVEEVGGISIDGYKDVPAEQAKGFDWSQGPKATTKTKSKPLPKYQKREVSAKSIYHESNSFPTAFAVILLSLLPFGLWFGVMKGLEQKETEANPQFENVVDIQAERFRREQAHHHDDDGDSNVPKAS